VLSDFRQCSSKYYNNCCIRTKYLLDTDTIKKSVIDDVYLKKKKNYYTIYNSKLKRRSLPFDGVEFEKRLIYDTGNRFSAVLVEQTNINCNTVKSAGVESVFVYGIDISIYIFVC